MRRYDSVLVTGASRGLGAALARELLARDYRVILTARSEDSLRRTAESLPASGPGRVGWLAADLSRPEDITALAVGVEQRFGVPDVLINNAGIGHYKPLTQWSPRELIDCMNVNLLAPMLLSQAFMRSFIARRHGMIVNIGSDLSRRYLAQMAPYVATKFGLLGFSGSLLREAKGHGVKVMSVLPGMMDTGFGGGAEGSRDESSAMRPAMLASRIVDLLELPENVIADEITLHPMQQDF